MQSKSGDPTNVGRNETNESSASVSASVSAGDSVSASDGDDDFSLGVIFFFSSWSLPESVPTRSSGCYNAFMESRNDTHSLAIGYVLWIFGFMGAHRFYYGKPISGTIWFFTGGLLLIGWVVDLFLMPSLERSAERRYANGRIDYSLAWILLTFLGVFGLHRLYLGKIWTAVLYFFTGGLFFIGVLYDFWTLNEQIQEANTSPG